MPNKIARIFIAIILLIISILIAAPFAIDTSPIKSQLEEKISQKIGADFKVNGKVSVAFFPLPSISLSNVAITKLVVDDQHHSDIGIKNLIIKPSIFSLFSKNIQINGLIFDNPNINNKYDTKADKKTPELEKIPAEAPTEAPTEVTKTANKKSSSSVFNFEEIGKNTFSFYSIKSIQFKNGYFLQHNTDEEVTLEFRDINFSLKNNLKKQIFTVQGGFLSNEEPTSFILVANAKNKEESSLKIQSAILNLSLNGKFSNSHIDDLIRSNFIGKVNAEIIDLKAFLTKYVSKNHLLYRKINSTQPIKISANIENEAGKIDIGNIIIESQLMAGKGQINANFTGEKPAISADFDFNNIDIGSIWFSGALNNSPNVINFENEIIQKFLGPQIVDISDQNKTYLLPDQTNPQPKDFQLTSHSAFAGVDLKAKIKIKSAKYYNGDLSNISLNFVTENGNFLLKPLSAEIPGNGILTMNGSLERDNDIPKFIGKIEISGQNLQKSLAWLGIEPKNLKPNILTEYALSSDLLILPNFNIFNNLSLAINNSTNIVVGNLKIDDSLGISKSTANLRFNYLKYDDYFLDIGQSPYLSSGSLLKKLLWLNTINSNNDITLSFDQLNYRDNIFDNPSLAIKFRQGYFKLSDLDFLSPTLDFKGNIEVDISSVSPTLNINIASDNFQYQSQNLSDKNDEDLGNQFFKLPAINEFSGEIAINIKNLLLNSWQASDVKIAGKIDSAIVNFDNFNLKTYQGEAVYKGSMVFKNAKTINGSVELIGVDAGQVLFNLMNINNISGISNLSAVISSNAENKKEFFKNLDSSGQFIGANIAMKGFGIYDLAFKVAQPKKYQAELGKLNNILYNPDIITTFANVSGAFAIKKGENQGQLNIQTSSVGINGVVSGAFDIASQSFDSNANFIFISGTRQNQIPLNIAVNFKGSVGAIEKSTNLTQVEQYLNQKLPSPTPPATVNPPQN